MTTVATPAKGLEGVVAATTRLSDVLGGYAVATLLLVPYCWAYTRWLRKDRQAQKQRSFLRPGREVERLQRRG